MTPGARNLTLGLLCGLTAALTWGIQAVVARSGTVAGYSPLDLAVLRYVAAGLVLLPFAWRSRRALAALGPWKLAVLVVTGGAGNALMFGWGLVHAPASHGGTVAPITSALMGAAFAVPLLGEWPTRGRALALACIAAGVLLIGWDGIAGTAPGAWRGDIILMGAGSLWGAFTVLLRRWQVPALAGNAAICGLSALLLLPPWLLLGGGVVPEMPWQSSLLQAFAQGVLSSAIATTLYAQAASYLGATRTACLTSMVPVAAVVLAFLILGEPLGAAKVSGVVLAVGAMLGAVLFTGRRTAPR